MSMSKVLTRYSLPAIIGLKVLVVAAIVKDQEWVRLGEKTLRAADEPTRPEPTVPPAVGTTAPAQEGEGQEQKRRSFLDDLLYLPQIQTEELKKDEIGRYLTLIERKQSQIENRISILRSREEQLKALEASVDEKIKKLEEELVFFQGTVQKEKDLQGERLDKLVEFYQKMEPKKAAPVFERLDRDLVVALFNRFPQKQTTQILALMNPERSVELSEYYGRIRSGKEYELLKEMNLALRKEFEECKGLPAQVP